MAAEGVSRRALLALCSLAFAAFAAYGSLVPLDVRLMPLGDALARFTAVRWVPLAYASKSDFIANVSLFVPIGFFLTGAIADRSRVLSFLLLPVVLACAFAWSVGIEFGQVYSATRTPSFNDIVAETLGAFMGALAYTMAGPPLVGAVGRIRTSESRVDRLVRLLAVYAAIWVVLGSLPFDFILRVEELGEKVREGGVVLNPAGNGEGTLARLMDVGAAALMAIPIGALAALLLRGIGGLLAGTAAVIALELLQVFVRSRTADIADVAGGVIGIAVGYFALQRTYWSANPSWASASTVGTRRHVWAALLLVVWCGVLALRHWDPFDFRLDPAFVRARLRHFGEIPFRGYYWAMPMDALGEALTKLLMGVPVGALLETATPALRSVAGQVLRLAGLCVVTAGVFLAVELGQVLLPTRFPDATDVLIGTAGGVVGLIAARLVVPAGPIRTER